MKWYFALNEKSATSDLYSRCIEAAVLSALQRTSLEPHFIFDGEECDLTARLRRLGAKVIFHRTSLHEAIIAAKPDDLGWQQIAHGAFLRLDLPFIDLESHYALYTDCDVLFLSDPSISCIKPALFAVAPEFTIGDFENMNTGVMVMNLPAMRDASRALIEFISPRLADFPAFDQGALRAFFKGRFERLPEVLNWKPYWGLNDSAQIIHFHGPKPPQIRAIQAGHEIPQILHDLYNIDKEYYAIAISLWDSYVARAARL